MIDIAQLPGGPAASWSEPRSASADRARTPAERRRSATDSSRGSSSPERRRARMTAPTAATSSSSDAISNASRNLVRNSSPICAGEPKPSKNPVPSLVEHAQARAEHRDRDLDQQRAREQHRDRAHARPVVRASGSVLAADVGDHEHVEHHHRAGVDDHLRGGDELRAQQQEQRRQPEQVADEREHRVERVAQEHGADRAAQGDRCAAMKKMTSAMHAARAGSHYSPAARSGVRSSGSASSISFVKIRSERL